MQINVNELFFSYGHNVSHVISDGYLVHSHSFPEIYYFLRGDVDVLLSGVEYHMKPHTMLLYPPGAYHGIRVNSDAPYERITLHLEPSVLSFERRAQLMAVLPKAGMNPGFPLYWPAMQGTGIWESLLQLDDCAALSKAQQKALMPIFIEAVLARMLCHMQTSLPVSQPVYAASKSQGSSILYYLDEHFAQPISLDMLAERFFVSKSHLNQMFRKMTGTTVMDYVTHKRVNFVQQLLSGGVSAVQAAQAAGFGDYTSFYRAYVKIFAHAPSVDKRQLAGKSTAQKPVPVDSLRSFVYRTTNRQQPETEPTIWTRQKTGLEGFGDPALLKDEQQP